MTAAERARLMGHPAGVDYLSEQPEFDLVEADSLVVPAPVPTRDIQQERLEVAGILKR